MPTVILEQGFRFFFYSNENEEPMHVHIVKGDGEGKVWLEPEVKIAYMNGFSPQEVRQITRIISVKLIFLQQRWNEYFAQ